MAEQLQVNRTTVREALHKLESLDLIEIKHGNGIFVKDWRDSGSLELAKHILFMDGQLNLEVSKNLMDLRRLLVPEISYFAAQNRSEADLEDLERTALRSEDLPLEERDWRVHNIIARASGNLLFLILLNSFTDLAGRLTNLYFPIARQLPALGAIPPGNFRGHPGPATRAGLGDHEGRAAVRRGTVAGRVGVRCEEQPGRPGGKAMIANQVNSIGVMKRKAALTIAAAVLVLAAAGPALAGGLPKATSKIPEAQKLLDQAWAQEKADVSAASWKKCIGLAEQADKLRPEQLDDPGRPLALLLGTHQLVAQADRGPAEATGRALHPGPRRGRPVAEGQGDLLRSLLVRGQQGLDPGVEFHLRPGCGLPRPLQPLSVGGGPRPGLFLRRRRPVLGRGAVAHPQGGDRDPRPEVSRRGRGPDQPGHPEGPALSSQLRLQGPLHVEFLSESSPRR
ncbi:MAG: GntR family transcriptional regulator [Desulfosudis oleivorans]|nr:GntR family transcriptional regulator [Desulfosudis oleivorans]